MLWWWSTSKPVDRSSNNGSDNNNIKVSGGSSTCSNDMHSASNIKHLLFIDIKQQVKTADQGTTASPTSSSSSMFSTSTFVDSTSSADSIILSSTSSPHCSTSIFTDDPVASSACSKSSRLITSETQVGDITINMLQHTQAKLPTPTAYDSTSNFMEWARELRISCSPTTSNTSHSWTMPRPMTLRLLLMTSLTYSRQFCWTWRR